MGNTRPVAVVTGGTSGIGLAIVKTLSTTHDVYAIGRAKTALAELSLHDNIKGVALDLLDHAAQKTFINSLSSIDVLVHSAAISPRYSVEEATPDVWQKTFAINLFAPAELTRLALPKLRHAKGQVVFINSGSGTLALAGHTVYSASKFALNALAHALRNEESAQGVRVATVSPGPTDTPMNKKDRDNTSITDPLAFSNPVSVAKAVRLIVDTTEESQITDITVRPRFDAAKR